MGQMTKFLTYTFLLIVLFGAGASAFDSPDNSPLSTVPFLVSSTVPATTETSVPVTTSTIAAVPVSTFPIADLLEGSGKSGISRTPSRKYTPSRTEEIDCDKAEELYDDGEIDNLADYCDYGPDDDWDNNDEYDGFDE